MPDLELKLFGTFEAVLDGKPLTRFESDKTRALLIYLAVEKSGHIPRDKVAGMLWPETTENRARQNLSQALYTLRKLLKENSTAPRYFQSTAHHISFIGSEHTTTDLDRFFTLLKRLDDHPHRRLEGCSNCLDKLGEAVELYHAPLLQNFFLKESFEFEEWLVLTRENAHFKAIQALNTISQHYFLRGEFAQSLKYARKLVQLDPWQEAAHRRMMVALALSGRREDALRQYEVCRLALAKEIGVEPEPETQELFQNIRNADIAAFMPRAIRNNLPAPLTPFVGRETELEHLQSLLNHRECRLITVLGAGGCGKTRLAIEAARLERFSFPDGVLFVPLTAVSTLNELPSAVAESAGLKFREGLPPAQQLEDFLADKETLLILDNFEHILTGTAWLSQLLRSAPGVTALVTSRARLNASGEHVFPLGGLDVPPESDEFPLSEIDLEAFSGPTLFLRTARRTHPGFRLQAKDVRAVRDLCAAVDGMPLALILAVPWLGSMPVHEILKNIQLDHNFLATEKWDLPTRQRSLKAVCDHSWNLLNQDEKEVFTRLSLISGKISPAAAAAVAGATPALLAGLVQKSFLSSETGGDYIVHEVLRQYGREKLDTEPEILEDVRTAHAVFFLSEVATQLHKIKTGRMEEALEAIRKYWSNITEAWFTSTSAGYQELLGKSMEGLGLYLSLTYDPEDGAELMTRGVDQSAPADHRNAIQAALWLSEFERALGNEVGADNAHALAGRVLPDYSSAQPDDHWLPGFHAYQSAQHLQAEDRQGALNHYANSIEHFQKAADPYWEARSTVAMGLLYHHMGQYQSSDAAFQRGVDILTQIGDQRGVANAMLMGGFNKIRSGKVAEGVAQMQQAAEFLSKLNNPADQAYAMSRLGISLVWIGKHKEGVTLLRKSIQMYRKLGARFEAIYNSFLMAYGEVDFVPYEEIRQRLLQDIQIARERKYLREEAIIYQLLGWLDAAENPTQNTVEQLEQSVSMFRQLKQRDDLGWTLAIFGLVLIKMGRIDEGRNRLFEALQVSLELRSMMPALLSIPGAILLFLGNGQIERALELWGVIQAHPGTGETLRWWMDICGRKLFHAAADIPDTEKEAILQRGAELVRQLPELAKNLITELDLSGEVS